MNVVSVKRGLFSSHPVSFSLVLLDFTAFRFDVTNHNLVYLYVSKPTTYHQSSHDVELLESLCRKIGEAPETENILNTRLLNIWS